MKASEVTEYGYYWMDAFGAFEVVEVAYNGGAELAVFYCGSDNSDYLKDIDASFIGPIDPPQVCA